MTRLKAATKLYPHREGPALKRVSPGVPPGQFVYLTGPSGGGKTPLLRLLYGRSCPANGGHLSFNRRHPV
ncbi:MAG: ATP-binding cassette domain-containing protein [Desulfarculaceae bacterium]|nr:ATP-binding cassette domain-containing protein [Desulfarculaceae bacterium]MCF8099389.1 ATP-binding cassette domain-containing protein [Desulfarculaceae bacterium]MCF8124457.1 ATP-binding cassette domain-containing protein [Desulfarculaceae bacterium]